MQITERGSNLVKWRHIKHWVCSQKITRDTWKASSVLTWYWPECRGCRKLWWCCEQTKNTPRWHTGLQRESPQERSILHFKIQEGRHYLPPSFCPAATHSDFSTISCQCGLQRNQMLETAPGELISFSPMTTGGQMSGRKAFWILNETFPKGSVMCSSRTQYIFDWITYMWLRTTAPRPFLTPLIFFFK